MEISWHALELDFKVLRDDDAQKLYFHCAMLHLNSKDVNNELTKSIYKIEVGNLFPNLLNMPTTGEIFHFNFRYSFSMINFHSKKYPNKEIVKLLLYCSSACEQIFCFRGSSFLFMSFVYIVWMYFKHIFYYFRLSKTI